MDTLIPYKPCGQYMYHYVNMSANIAKINDIEYKWTLSSLLNLVVSICTITLI